MPRCTFKNTAGKVCNLKSDHLQFVLLNDPHDRIVMKKYGCIQHMNIIIDYLMVNQLGRDNLMKALQIQIEKLTEEMHKGTNLSEERQKIRDAKKDGLPEPKMKKTQEYKKEINELWTQWKGHKKIQVKLRNRHCVFCTFPLHDPEEPKDQIGGKFANADFKDAKGNRRYDAVFHSECFITWYSNKFDLDQKEMKYISPKRTGQGLLFDFSTPD